MTIYKVIAMSLALALGACGSDNTTADGAGVKADAGGDVGTRIELSSKFKGVEAYTGHKGTVTIAVETFGGVNKVELLADGGKVLASATTAPFDLSWDTSSSDDGIVKLKLRSTDGVIVHTSDELPVIVYNTGQRVTLKESAEQEMTIPVGPALEFDLKWHWTMPADVTRIIAVAWWTNAAFKTDLALGTGECPDNGTEAKRVASDTSPVVTEYKGSAALTKVMWFAHVGPTNKSEVEGQKTKVSTHVYLLR